MWGLSRVVAVGSGQVQWRVRVRCSSARCGYLSCFSFSLTIVIGIEQAFNTDWVEEPINTLEVEPTTTAARSIHQTSRHQEPKLHEGREHYLLKSDT